MRIVRSQGICRLLAPVLIAESSAMIVVSEKVQPEQTRRPAPVRFPLFRQPVEVLQICDVRIVRTSGAQKRHVPRGMRVSGRDAPQECRLHGPWSNAGNRPGGHPHQRRGLACRQSWIAYRARRTAHQPQRAPRLVSSSRPIPDNVPR